ncbi:hypothetical protein F4678DRAFT_458114 [Xylaria arbuscula]|nr:hypothetical protein F4678DRAFT_458114 [Xylaria arbuscula]
MPGQELDANGPRNVGSSLTCIEFDILYHAAFCIKDVNDRDEDRIDFDKLANLIGYLSAGSIRAQWRIMQQIVAEITGEAIVPPAFDIAAIIRNYNIQIRNESNENNKNNKNESNKGKQRKELKQQVNNPTTHVNEPRTRVQETQSEPNPTRTNSPTPDQFNERMQRMWDEGLISGGFGPGEMFGSGLVPPPPPAGYGFGMGTYDDFDDDENSSFKGWN